MKTLFAHDNGRYIGIYTERACKNLWGVIWRTTRYFDKCYFGKRLICMPGYMPLKIEWI